MDKVRPFPRQALAANTCSSWHIKWNLYANEPEIGCSPVVVKQSASLGLILLVFARSGSGRLDLLGREKNGRAAGPGLSINTALLGLNLSFI